MPAKTGKRLWELSASDDLSSELLLHEAEARERSGLEMRCWAAPRPTPSMGNGAQATTRSPRRAIWLSGTTRVWEIIGLLTNLGC